MTFSESCGNLPLMTNAFFAIESCKSGDSFRLEDLNFRCDVDNVWARGHDFAIMMGDGQSGKSVISFNFTIAQ